MSDLEKEENKSSSPINNKKNECKTRYEKLGIPGKIQIKKL